MIEFINGLVVGLVVGIVATAWYFMTIPKSKKKAAYNEFKKSIRDRKLSVDEFINVVEELI